MNWLLELKRQVDIAIQMENAGMFKYDPDCHKKYPLPPGCNARIGDFGILVPDRFTRETSVPNPDCVTSSDGEVTESGVWPEPKPIFLTFDFRDVLAFGVAIGSGIEYLRECIAVHESNLGRTTLKNKLWAERMEADLKQMQDSAARLEKFSRAAKP